MNESTHHQASGSTPFRVSHFPPAVWATAFATFVAFMGIGVVDPILPLIGRAMGATPSQVEGLFTSYIAVMAVAMLVSGVLATRLGGKRTLLAGLGVVVVFATASGLSPNIGVLALVRGGWGFGNALFTSTALSIIVGLSLGGMGVAITLYEAALGLGIASGPLIGGWLGSQYWRDPFFGTASLMAIAFVATWAYVKEPPRREPARTARDILAAMKNRPVLTNALIGLSYSYAFFTILAYSPLTLAHLKPIQLGVTYFFWGILVAVSSVLLVNWLLTRWPATSILVMDLSCLAVLFVAAGLVHGSGLLDAIVVSGLFCGVANALFTTMAMEVSPFSRSIRSGAYTSLHWAGAAIAPVASGLVDQAFGVHVPFFVGAAMLVVGTIALFSRRNLLEGAMRVEQARAQ